jgi:thiopeptide-type bacteriocin biosynthesis protein
MATTETTINQACLENLRLLIERRADADASLDVTDQAASVSEFLVDCARTLIALPGSESERYPDEFYRARDTFVRGGLDALAAGIYRDNNSWLQIGIRPHEELQARGELCHRIASLARTLLSESTVDDFFFMHKPPGLRLRFHIASPASSADVADVVHAEIMRWHAEKLIDHVEPGVYEPESHLFGGARSMSFVHALFTVDSLLWLDYHASRAGADDASSPAWLVSLAALRPVFAGLGITGWEDIGVWDAIRKKGGRRLEADKMSEPVYADIARGLRAAWSRGDSIVDALDPTVKAIVGDLGSALLSGATRWRSSYFCQQGASLGPRAAGALYVIFHWNRAGLSHTEQALLAEALSEQVFDDAHE